MGYFQAEIHAKILKNERVIKEIHTKGKGFFYTSLRLLEKDPLMNSKFR